MAVRLIGSALPASQQALIKNEIYGENDGDTLTLEALMSGLNLAAELVTDEVVSYEKTHSAYVKKC